MFVVLDRACKDNTRALLDEFATHEPRLTVIWAPENTNVVDAYVRGYREAMIYVQSRADDPVLDWDPELIKAIHHRVLAGRPGAGRYGGDPSAR